MAVFYQMKYPFGGKRKAGISDRLGRIVAMAGCWLKDAARCIISKRFVVTIELGRRERVYGIQALRLPTFGLSLIVTAMGCIPCQSLATEPVLGVAEFIVPNAVSQEGPWYDIDAVPGMVRKSRRAPNGSLQFQLKTPTGATRALKEDTRAGARQVHKQYAEEMYRDSKGEGRCMPIGSAGRRTIQCFQRAKHQNRGVQVADRRLRTRQEPSCGIKGIAINDPHHRQSSPIMPTTLCR